jgi:hypothetical protein
LQYERANLMKKIDDEYDREDLIEKGIRKMTKAIGQ